MSAFHCTSHIHKCRRRRTIEQLVAVRETARAMIARVVRGGRSFTLQAPDERSFKSAAKDAVPATMP